MPPSGRTNERANSHFRLALRKRPWAIYVLVLPFLVGSLATCRLRRLDEPLPDASISSANPPAPSAVSSAPGATTTSATAEPSASAPPATSSSSPPPGSSASAAPPASSAREPPLAESVKEPDGPKGAVVIALGGAGSDPSLSAEVESAIRASLGALARGATPVQAAAAGVVVLEDAPAFNAGQGSSLRLDGSSIHMDALVMDSEGRMGAVASIGLVRNPIRVALDVADATHGIMGGAGAISFARTRGHGAFDPWTPRARRQWEVAISKQSPEASTVVADAGTTPIVDTQEPAHNTVLLLRTRDGRFAAAASDGGPAAGVPGAIGAVPIPGAAVFVGPDGAVVASGPGNPLIHKALAHTIYERMTQSDSPRQAVVFGLEHVPSSILQVAVAAVNRRASHVGARGPMAWASSRPAGEMAPSGTGKP